MMLTMPLKYHKTEYHKCSRMLPLLHAYLKGHDTERPNLLETIQKEVRNLAGFKSYWVGFKWSPFHLASFSTSRPQAKVPWQGCLPWLQSSFLSQLWLIYSKVTCSVPAPTRKMTLLWQSKCFCPILLKLFFCDPCFVTKLAAPADGCNEKSFLEMYFWWGMMAHALDLGTWPLLAHVQAGKLTPYSPINTLGANSSRLAIPWHITASGKYWQHMI